MTDMADLPPEVRAEMGGGAHDFERISAIEQMIATKRQEYVAYRTESGIEEVWRQAEEAYVGMDDANRHEFGKARWAKPLTMTGPVETSDRSNRGADARSNVFIRLTSRYVDAGAAKLGEILLPPDDKAFSIKPTPIPELVAQKKNLAPVMLANGMPAMRDPTPDELEPGQLPSQAPGVQLTYADLAREKLEKADESATAAEKRIYDWMVESQYTGQQRKVIFDSARAGVGVVKSPFPDEKRARAMRRNESGQVELTILSKIQPSTRWVSFWNVYPDPACGENIQDGDYCFEKDGISERKLRKLARLPGYIKSAIDRVIVEGPDKCRVNDPGNPIQDANRHQYTIWYFHGAIKREEFLSATRKDPSQAAGLKREQEMVHCVATMVNDSVVRVVLNPLEASGEHPYHAIPWKRRPGHWAGVGISEQVAVPQRIINAATRAMLDNAGKSAGSIIAIDRKMLQPADGRWTLGRDKIFYTSPDAALEDIRKAKHYLEFLGQRWPAVSASDFVLGLGSEVPEWMRQVAWHIVMTANPMADPEQHRRDALRILDEQLAARAHVGDGIPRGDRAAPAEGPPADPTAPDGRDVGLVGHRPGAVRQLRPSTASAARMRRMISSPSARRSVPGVALMLMLTTVPPPNPPSPRIRRAKSAGTIDSP